MVYLVLKKGLQWCSPWPRRAWQHCRSLWGSQMHSPQAAWGVVSQGSLSNWRSWRSINDHLPWVSSFLLGCTAILYFPSGCVISIFSVPLQILFIQLLSQAIASVPFPAGFDQFYAGETWRSPHTCAAVGLDVSPSLHSWSMFLWLPSMECIYHGKQKDG